MICVTKISTLIQLKMIFLIFKKNRAYIETNWDPNNVFKILIIHFRNLKSL